VNIFLRELRANLKSLLIWCGIVILLIIMAVAKFQAFAGDPATIQMLDSMPAGLLDAFGLRAFNMTTLTGFYGVVFVYFGLMGAIAAVLWGSDTIAKEQRDKTVEFSLVLPVTRNRVVTAKALAALVNCVVFALVTWGASLVAVRSFAPDQAFYDYLRLQMGALLAIELIFLALGLLLGCALKQYRRAGSVGVAIILAAYFISIITSLQQSLDWMKWFTPFKYYDAADLFRSGRMDTTYLALSAVIIVVSLAAAYWIYNRRDLYI
jgi:ABC-2 type transport system permease protein